MAAHDRLMAYHANKSIALPAGTTTTYPTQAIVALWDPAITWIGGGWSSMKVSLQLVVQVSVGLPPAILSHARSLHNHHA